MLKVFRAIALIEGVTTLALFFVAMPMKYLLGNPALVPSMGLIHGLAFLVYLAAMAITLPSFSVGLRGWARTALAAFVPFGTFLNDGYLVKAGARN